MPNEGTPQRAAAASCTKSKLDLHLRTLQRTAIATEHQDTRPSEHPTYYQSNTQRNRGTDTRMELKASIVAAVWSRGAAVSEEAQEAPWQLAETSHAVDTRPARMAG